MDILRAACLHNPSNILQISYNVIMNPLLQLSDSLRSSVAKNSMLALS